MAPYALLLDIPPFVRDAVTAPLALLLDVPPFIGAFVALVMVLGVVASYFGSVVIEAIVMWCMKWNDGRRCVLDAFAMNGVSFAVGLFGAMAGWPFDRVWGTLLAVVPLVAVEWLVLRSMGRAGRDLAFPVAVISNAVSMPFLVGAISWLT